MSPPAQLIGVVVFPDIQQASFVIHHPEGQEKPATHHDPAHEWWPRDGEDGNSIDVRRFAEALDAIDDYGLFPWW